MIRVLDLLRARPAGPGASDRDLLDRFRAVRDGEAFAELVRRHGPVVWGACRRRLANPHDAEDAFQATFLVLVRRADRLGARPTLGPWLHKVAVLTARNIARGNHRRTAVALPNELPMFAADPAPRADLDAALLGLPEKYRVPVVLCHLQGLSRREAAARLGCPEGTLSALLSRALAKLRARLGDTAPAAALAIAGATAAPPDLTAATVRAATIYATSSLADAGVSPAVAGLTQGVLRMFWVKKAALAACAMIAVGLLAVVGASLTAPPHAVAADQPKKAAPPKADDEFKDLVPTYITGTVRDGDGKPIAGARVSKNGTIGYAATFGGTEFNGHAVSGPDGSYRIGFKTKPGTTVTITMIHAEADGHVAHTESFRYDELKTSPTAPGKWDFVLAKGEVIAGRVAEADPGDMIPILVRGPSFSREFFTAKDGTFRFWVPPGTYTVTAAVHTKFVTRDEKLPPEYRDGQIIKRAATAEKVRAGTEGLVLKTP